eukprot:4690825-Prymnesium_polylepis.1
MVLLHRLALNLGKLLGGVILLDAPVAPALAHVAQVLLHDLLVLLALLMERDRLRRAVDVEAAVLAPVLGRGDPVLRPAGSVQARGGLG